MPRPKPIPKPADDSYRDRQRVRLIQAAEAVLATEGLAALQARRVATEATCSVGTVYNIFGDIDGLILAANERTLHDLGNLLSATARRSTAADLQTRLMALATAYLDFATVNPRRWRAVFEHHVPDERPIPDAYLEDRKRLLALIETQLDSALAKPEARADASHALFSAVHGIVLLSIDAKLRPFDPAGCERQIRFIVEHVVRGLSKPQPSAD
jgi:AcrR family transcriptional regulator